MAGIFKKVAMSCAVFDRVTRQQGEALTGQLAEILPLPPDTTEDWQVARIYGDDGETFKEVWIRDRFLEQIDPTINGDDFAAQCLYAARAYGANHEALLAIAVYLTNIQNVAKRPSGACGPYLFLEDAWVNAWPSVAELAVTASDRFNPYLQPYVAAANSAKAMAKFRQELGGNRQPTLAELAFVHMFGQQSVDTLIRRIREPASDPSIETVIDNYCTNELEGTVDKAVLISEIAADQPNLLGPSGARLKVSNVIGILEGALTGPLNTAQGIIRNIPGLVEPVVTRPANVPADVAAVPPSNAAPFAVLAVPVAETFWPVITADPQAMVVSYVNTSGQIIGRASRQFNADRNGGARRHAGIDIFCREGDVVVACADGKIANFYAFYKRPNGEQTFAIFIAHNGVVINYGEVRGNASQEFNWRVGDNVVAGQPIGKVSGTNMIHFETYQPGITQNLRWATGAPRPSALQNPTMLLLTLASGAKRKEVNGSTTVNTGNPPGGPVLPTSVNADDLLTLARTIYGEARGEVQRGREAVAHVVMNRVRKGPPRYRRTVTEVCRQNRQFSCWNSGDPNLPVIRSILPGANAKFNECYAVAERVMTGQVADNTGGATHYYAQYIAAPNWTRPPAQLTTQIGVHKFYTNVA